MSEHESEFIKQLEETLAQAKISIIKYSIGVLGAIITAGVVFYFSTTYELKASNIRSNQLEVKIEKLEKEKASKEVISSQLETLTTSVGTITKSVDRIEKKVDDHMNVSIYRK